MKQRWLLIKYLHPGYWRNTGLLHATAGYYQPVVPEDATRHTASSEPDNILHIIGIWMFWERYPCREKKH